MTKTLHTLLFFSAFCATALAQPTLQMNVLPEIGDVVTFYDADTANVSEGSAGANQTWDFSGLEATAPGTQYIYLDPAATPAQFASNFPGANIAIKINEDTAVYTYAKKSASQLELLGAMNETFTQKYQNTDIQLKTLSFNNSFSDDFTNTSDNGTGFVFYGKGSRTVTYDAYGTLKTPAGTFTNAMRIKGVSSQVDSVDFGVGKLINRTTFTVYDWLVANQPGVLVSVYYTHLITETYFPGLDPFIEDFGTFKSVSYIDNFTVGTFDRPAELAGIQMDFSGANPAIEELALNINSDNRRDNIQMLLTDAAGRIVDTQVIALASGDNPLSIPVAHLPAGSYFLTLSDGQALKTLGWQKI